MRTNLIWSLPVSKEWTREGFDYHGNSLVGCKHAGVGQSLNTKAAAATVVLR